MSALLGVVLGGLAALGLVGWLYLRRRAPVQRLIPTLLFWEQVAEIGAAPDWLGRWRERLSLGLHLLGAGLLIGLLAWAWQLWGEATAPHLVVLERDPVLAAPAAAGGSLAESQREAVAAVLGQRRGEVALVVAEPAWRVLHGWSRDRSAAAAVLAGEGLPVRPGPAAGGVVAQTLLDSLVAELPGLGWTWVGVGPPPDLPQAPVQWHRLVPAGGGNSGIVRLSGRRDPRDPRRITLRARLQQSGADAAGSLELRRDGILRDRRNWTLSRGGHADLDWSEVATLDTHAYSLMITVDGADIWDADNRADLVVPAVAPVHVGLSGPVPVPLAQALAARARVEVVTAIPGGGGHDLVVVAGDAASEPWTDARAVWRIAPAAGAWGAPVGERTGVIALPPQPGWAAWEEVDPSGLPWERIEGYRSEPSWPVMLEGIDRDGNILPLIWRSPGSDSRSEIIFGVPVGAGEWIERPVYPMVMGSLLEEMRIPAGGVQADLPGPQASAVAGDPARVSGLAADATGTDRTPKLFRAWWWLVVLVLLWALAEAVTFTRRWTT